ncbi:hypothetical protein WDW89_21770, partial [Deltaproteobacteria bacterium TL4]
TLFEEEEKIREGVRSIAQGLLDVSDFVEAKGPVELAEAQVVGKRLRKVCDELLDELHKARKAVGLLLSHEKEGVIGGKTRQFSDIEDELSLIHGDVEAIAVIAENFYQSRNRSIAFNNLNRHYRDLVTHVTSVLVSK